MHNEEFCRQPPLQLGENTENEDDECGHVGSLKRLEDVGNNGLGLGTLPACKGNAKKGVFSGYQKIGPAHFALNTALLSDLLPVSPLWCDASSGAMLALSPGSEQSARNRRVRDGGEGMP